MKAVILAGGFGTRFSEETKEKPKPLIEIGKMPIIWHIMKNYSHHKINDFVICGGYKQEKIKEYFLSKFKHELMIKESNYIKLKIFQNNTEPWIVTIVDTGLETMTGGRLKKIKKFVTNETFCFTYGDTLNDLNISELIKFHKNSETFVTVTACQPPGKFGILNIQNETVVNFNEKILGDGGWISGGYFVLEPEVLDYIENDKTIWEREPLEKLAKEGNLSAYRHKEFWHPMDTLWDKNYLEDLWKENNAPWKRW